MTDKPAAGGSGGRDNPEARRIFEQAVKTTKKMFGGSSKFEEAAELFTQAGNLFKASKLRE